MALAHARATAIAKAVLCVAPSDLAPALSDAREALRRLEQARVDLDAGAGVYRGTEAGNAVVDLAHARAGLAEAPGAAAYAHHWRDRHAATRDTSRWAPLQAAALVRWRDHVVPEAERLDHQIAEHQPAVEALAARHDRQEAVGARLAHNGLGRRRDAGRLAAGLDAYRC